MKLVILSDKSYNYIRPIADGLEHTLVEMGHEVVNYHDGVYWLDRLNLIKVFFSDIGRLFANLKANTHNLYIYRFWNLLTFNNRKFKKNIKEADAVIVVYNCPGVFYKNSLTRIEELRNKYKKPILLYDFHFLPNQGWYKYILQQNPKNFGLERFDAYLLVSIVTEFAIPKEIPPFYHLVGMDIKSKNLFSEQNGFTVLLDFPRNGKDKEREMVKEVLKELNINYLELSGRYTTEQIRAIYRSADIYFPSTRESFGLTIAEMQLCGGYICVPFTHWMPAFYLEKDLFKACDGVLGTNFLCYNNDPSTLKKILLELKDRVIDHQQIIQNFKKQYPLYYSIDKEALSNCLNKVLSGEINFNTHNDFKKYNQYISLSDDYAIK